MTTTYIMCGLAFSGKSLAAKRVATHLNANLVGLEAINHERGLRGGEGISIEEWEKTSHLAMTKMAAALATGKSVVVDDTFSHRFLRDRCRLVAEKHGSLFLILYMDTPIEVIQARRTENYRDPVRHHVRDDVFVAHQDGFQHPQDDEPVVRVIGGVMLDRWLVRERNSN